MSPQPDFDSPGFDSVELHIEELVLHGFPVGNHAEIARHIEQELTNLLQQGDLPVSLSQGGTLPSLSGRSFYVASNATPQTVGAQVARSLYQGLSQ